MPRDSGILGERVRSCEHVRNLGPLQNLKCVLIKPRRFRRKLRFNLTIRLNHPEFPLLKLEWRVQVRKGGTPHGGEPSYHLGAPASRRHPLRPAGCRRSQDWDATHLTYLAASNASCRRAAAHICLATFCNGAENLKSPGSSRLDLAGVRQESRRFRDYAGVFASVRDGDH